MKEIINYLQENPTIAVIGAAVLLLIAGAVLRKAKIFGIILIIAASIIFYFLLSSKKIGKVDVDDVKKKVKDKVMENI